MAKPTGACIDGPDIEDTVIGRMPVINVAPVVENGRLPAKAVVGERVPIGATVFREGHDAVACTAVLTDPDGVDHTAVRMRMGTPGTDRYSATVRPDRTGDWTFRIEAWSDVYATWAHDAQVKIDAGVDVELMLTEGSLLFGREAERSRGDRAVLLAEAARTLADATLPVPVRLAAGLDVEVRAELAANPIRELVSKSPAYLLRVSRRRALTGAWYEFFPRSIGATQAPDGTWTSGTFATATRHLDYVASMGFDVVYLPPVHPIGRVNRKGRNNTMDPGPNDPGSPWGIGSAEGGHDALHPELGTFEDFDAMVARANELGIEVAIDLALQCAPDHPWATAHPEWFTTRADGSIAYAENPPKKYQDIYPLNFDNDPAGLYAESLRVVRHWIDHGVTIFRVDNPHTKPVRFWEWLLGEIRESDPDVLFLSEAFTRPAMMGTLAKIGFHQSYTYFTWRLNKGEIADYLDELAHETSDYFRPNFFTNTQDILSAYLVNGGEHAFTIRAALAALASPSYGVYSGFELFENVPLRPGSEEYLNSEKYEYRPRDLVAARNEGRGLSRFLTRLNEIRRAHPALQQLRDLTIQHTDNDNLLAFSKREVADDGTSDVVIVVLSLDPHNVQSGRVYLDMPSLGLEYGQTFSVHEEITGADWSWWQDNFVQLNPWACPVHVLHVRT
jgi:starch synthase (maltosyl-transferring)